MRIDCHTHVFNLRTILSQDSLEMIRDRARRELEPPWLGEAVAELGAEMLEDLAGFDEERLLRRLLDRLGLADRVLDEVADAAHLGAKKRQLLEDWLNRASLSFLRRAVSGLLGRLRRKTQGPNRKSLANVIDMLRLITRSRIADVADRLLREIPDGGGAVLLALDITRGAGGQDLFDEQIRQTGDLVFLHPGRVFPFYGLDPRRPKPLDRLKKAVEELGYVGVKLYPSMGWTVADPAVAPVYDYCEEHDLPLLMHCNEGGFYAAKQDTRNADPDHWRPILANHPRLKVCFAHFGGGGGLLGQTSPIPADHWAAKIVALMEGFEGVCADISAHAAPLKDDNTRRRYFGNLRTLLARAPVGDRILLGTDFWLMRPRLSEAEHWQFFLDNLEPDELDRIGRDNTRRFLGLPDATGVAAEAIGLYADRIADNLDRLRAPAAPWLLELIGQRRGAARRAEIEALAARLQPGGSHLAVRDWQGRLAQLVERLHASEKEVDLTTGTVGILGTEYNGVAIGLTGEGSFAVSRFSDSDQQDPDRVLVMGAPPSSSDEEPPQPALVFDAQSQWLKYRLGGKLRVKAEGTLASVGLNLVAEGDVGFLDYRRHPGGAEEVAPAVARDLSRPRFALRLADVLEMAEGDALVFERRGVLSAGASVSFAEVLAGSLPVLARAAGLAGPLAIRVDLGATISASIRLEDDFRIVFARHGERYFVGITKLDSSRSEVGFALSAQIAFDRPEAVEALLGQLVARRLGEPLAQVEKLLKKLEGGTALSAPEKGRLEAIQQRLGAEAASKVRGKLADLMGDLHRKIEEVAAQRLRLGFAFEYARLSSRQTLLEAEITREALEELHDQLVDGELGGALDRADEAPEEVAIHRYLVERRKETRRSWGFNLGSTIFGRDTDTRGFSRQELRTAGGGVRRRFAFHGARGYEGSWLQGKTWKWKVDFKAQMERFSAGPDPLAREFDCGLAFLFEWGFKKLKAADLVTVLDAAALWGAVAETQQGDADPLATAGAPIGSGDLVGRRVDLRLQLLVPDEALELLLPKARRADTALMGQTLGAAMPWRDDPLRRGVASRRRAYGLLWQELLEEAQEPGWILEKDRWAQRAFNQVRPINLNQANWETEDQALSGNFMWTFVGMLAANGSPCDKWLRFLSGLGRLPVLGGPDNSTADSEAIQRAYGEMKPFWSQTHWVRAAGAYLVACAPSTGGRSLVRATLAAELTDPATGGEVLLLGHA